MEQKIAFIIEQQASFFAGLKEVKALQARTDVRLDRAICLGVLEVRRERVKRRELAGKLAALIDAQIRAKVETALLKEAMREMAQAVTQTNRRIDKLDSSGNGK